jgi:hypothetical protein
MEILVPIVRVDQLPKLDRKLTMRHTTFRLAFPPQNFSLCQNNAAAIPGVSRLRRSNGFVYYPPHRFTLLPVRVFLPHTTIETANVLAANAGVSSGRRGES